MLFVLAQIRTAYQILLTTHEFKLSKCSAKHIHIFAKAVYSIHTLMLERCDRSGSALRLLTINMIHTEHQESHSMTPQFRLLYGLTDDKPAFQDALFVRLQHICTIFILIYTPSLLITAALGYKPSRASYILGMSLSRLGTFMQVNKLRQINFNLLSLMQISFSRFLHLTHQICHSPSYRNCCDIN